MATWSTDSADFIKNLNNEEYERKKAEEQLAYDRKRLAVLDQRAKQDYDLNYAARLRGDALAKAQHDYAMRNLAETQKLADLDRRRKFNDLAEAQRKSDLNKAQHDYAMRNLAETQKLADLTRQNALATQQNQLAAQNDIALQRNFSSRTYTPYQEALLKLNANGGNINALSDDEKNIIYQKLEEENQYTPDEEDFKVLVTPEYQKEQGINLDFVPLYARQLRAAAAKDVEYQRKNAPAIAKQKQQEQYNTVSGFMTGFYNDAVSKGKIDPNVAKSKDVVDAATRIFIASNGSLTPEQAFYQAAGIRAKNTPPPPEGVSEIENNQLNRLYGKRYQKFDDETKTKLAAVYSEWKEKYEPSADLTGDAYYQAAQRRAVAYQDLLKQHELPTDLSTPIDEELYHLEYDNIHNELLAREKAISGKFPRWYSWVKNNPNVRIGSYTMAKNLINHSKDQMTTVEQSQRHSQEYKSFLDELNKIQQLRNDLVNREAWLKKLDANRRYGNK